MIKPDRDWILRTPAGPDMDLTVSMYVMGMYTFSPRPYSSDIAAAWEVVAVAREWPYPRVREFSSLLRSVVSIRLEFDYLMDERDMLMMLTAEDICKAALLTTLTEAP